MVGVKDATQPAPPATAEDCLILALEAAGPEARLRVASDGLRSFAAELEADTRVLLLRQQYLAYLELGDLDEAVVIATLMASVGPLADVAHHDRARALWAVGEREAAIVAQRQAGRVAPVERRSFQLWGLATFQYLDDRHEAALDTLDRALRWAHRDRPLLEAHAALIALEAAIAVEDLEGIVARLLAAPCREGYGQYVLGMIAHEVGDEAKAAVHLHAFLRRNASADEAKRITLAAELDRARKTVAGIDAS